MEKVNDLLTENFVKFKEKISFARNNAMVLVFSKTHYGIYCSIHCDYMSNQLDLIVFIFHWITIKESRQIDEKETPENEPWIKGNHNTRYSKEIYLLALLSSKICLIISPPPCLHDIICYYQVWSIAVYASLNPSTRRNVWRTNAPHF